MLRLLGIDEDVAALSADYCRIYVAGLWPVLMSRCLQGFLRWEQRLGLPRA